MAAISKTYVDEEQYKLVREFWFKTREQQELECGLIYLMPITYQLNYPKTDSEYLTTDGNYDELSNYTDKSEITIWNTTQLQDIWLKHNCPLDFIQSRLEEQYGDWLWNDLKPDFKENCNKIVSIESESKESEIYFFENIDGNDLKFAEEIHFVGTTYGFKFIQEAIKTVNHNIESDISLLLRFLGHTFVYGNNKWFLEGNEINFTSFVHSGMLPKIKHSVKLKNNKFNKETLHICDEENVYPLTSYKGYENINFKRINIMIPKYFCEIETI
jgi:hypothetical protein